MKISQLDGQKHHLSTPWPAAGSSCRLDLRDASDVRRVPVVTMGSPSCHGEMSRRDASWIAKKNIKLDMCNLHTWHQTIHQIHTINAGVTNGHDLSWSSNIPSHPLEEDDWTARPVTSTRVCRSWPWWFSASPVLEAWKPRASRKLLPWNEGLGKMVRFNGYEVLLIDVYLYWIIL